MKRLPSWRALLALSAFLSAASPLPAFFASVPLPALSKEPAEHAGATSDEEPDLQGGIRLVLEARMDKAVETALAQEGRFLRDAADRDFLVTGPVLVPGASASDPYRFC